MRLPRQPFAALVLLCCVLGACGSDKPAATATGSSIAQPSSGSGATQPPTGDGNVDCAVVKANLSSLVVNWQVVIGLSNSPTSGWATTPIGSITKFGDQVAAIAGELGGDPDAASALAFMSKANDIVVRGIGGDTTAQADLATYMGDGGANIVKQLAISTAYRNAGC
jgi:hypothetical protein